MVRSLMSVSVKHASWVALLTLLASAGYQARVQREGVDNAARADSVAGVDPALLRGLSYRMIGPHRGGRSTAVTGVAGDHRTFYMGATGGGVWKTTDAGEVWENVSDRFFKTGSVGAIAVADSNPKVVYVGTGSACIRNNVEVGNGAYKSADAGATWQSIGLEDAGQIGKIRIDPRDANRVYLAALGHAFGPNPMRGVFRSRDGGQTWEKVLFVNGQTGAADLVMDAHDSRVLYAAMWTGERKPWGLVGGSTAGGVFKTVDGGDHWTRLSSGLPQGPVGRIGVAVSGGNANRVWALVDASDGGIFRSDDAGKTFRRINADRRFTGRSWYYAHIFADPKDPNGVYVGNQDFHRSSDGGATFTPIAMPHGDNHDLWVDPQDPRVMIEGNDGGATISVNGGASWSTQLNQPTAEMYRVTVDDQVPYRVYGAQQDQYDALSLPSRTANFGARLQLQHWYAVGGMEGGFVAVDPRNSDIVYADGPGGMMTAFDRATEHLRSINVWPEAGKANMRFRFAWTSPVFTSPLDPENVYHTSNYVHRSSDGGQTWRVISPDLTRNDKSRPAAANQVGAEAESYPTVSTFAESPRQRGLFWAGSDDGLVQVSRDDGASWKNVTPKGLPEFATVQAVEPSRHDPARAFIAAHRYMLDDDRPYIFRTDDYGASWTLLTDGTNGIPATHFVHVVREDPVREGLLYAGTEFGAYVSFDDGRHWQPLQLNLPVTPISDLLVHDSDLVLSTNGRSFWILDDISPLRELAVQPFTSAHLFTPRDTYRIATSAEEADQAYVGGACCVSNARDLYAGARIERHQLGEEPPDGAILYASFPQVPSEPLSLAIVGPDNNVLRTIVDTGRRGQGGQSEQAPPLSAGLNRFVWDLRVESGPARPNLRGPKAVPGVYQVRLTVGGRAQSASFRLLRNPRLQLTDEDFRRQYDLLTRITGAMTEIQQAVATIRDRRKAGQGDQAALAEIERELVPAEGGGRGGRGSASVPLLNECSTLYEFVAGSEDKPTSGAVERWEELRRAIDERLAKVK
jgi:photosystem II stability/assembly factor-like uncharacterized protein